VIALVSGLVAVRRPDHVVIDCGGVGYRLSVSAQTLRQVPAAGSTVMLHTQLIAREDALTLYGFATEQERDLFLLLLGVQSVGPKLALEVLSGAPASELLGAIAAGNSARFQAFKGVGKRTAERIIVELREKVGSPASDQPQHTSVPDEPHELAREGLIGLGYSLQEAQTLLDGLPGATAEALIAGALKAARR
jgi:Holliday junction DNA helicase RuvA